MAFTIYIKNIGGRKFNRYYHNWEKAQQQLQEDLQDLQNSGSTITGHKDSMNVAKGWYDYSYTLRTDEGETAELTLVDGYFSDEE